MAANPLVQARIDEEVAIIAATREAKRLEEHETRVKALQNALNAGLQSGEPRLFDSQAFLSRMHAQHG